MACHLNKTLNRDVPPLKFPPVWQDPRGSAAGGSLKRSFLLAFQKLSTNKDFGSQNWLLFQACPLTFHFGRTMMRRRRQALRGCGTRTPSSATSTSPPPTTKTSALPLHPRVGARQSQKSIPRIYRGIDLKRRFPLPLK